MTSAYLIGYVCCLTMLVPRLIITTSEAKFSYSRGFDVLSLQAGERSMLEVNFSGIDTDVYIEVHSDNQQFFRIVGNSSFAFLVSVRHDVFDNSSNLDKIYTFPVLVKGIFIGISRLSFKVRPVNFRPNPELAIDPVVVKVRRKPSLVADIFQYVIFVWLILSYISMGVKINWTEIWKKLRRPWGVIVGALCQFTIMPLLAFALVKITHLESVSALGLIIFGCCPGGWLSNIFTLLLDCDLTLSVTMTTCSTVLAIAMMPLNLFIYARSYASKDKSLQTPFVNLIIQLLILLIPIGVGMVIFYKLPKLANFLKRALRPIAVLMLVFALGVGVPSTLYIFKTSAKVYLVTIIFPFIGGTLGLLLAKIACLENRSAVTVALETGSQNAVVALSIAGLSYPQPEADLITRIPNLIAGFTIIEGSIIAIIYVIMKRFPGKKQSDDDTESEDAVITYEPNSRESRKKQGRKEDKNDAQILDESAKTNGALSINESVPSVSRKISEDTSISRNSFNFSTDTGSHISDTVGDSGTHKCGRKDNDPSDKRDLQVPNGMVKANSAFSVNESVSSLSKLVKISEDAQLCTHYSHNTYV